MNDALLSTEPSCLASASIHLKSKIKLSMSLSLSTAEPLQDLLALRYCLCSIVRCMALQFADVDSSAFTLHLRRMLFLAFSTWTEEGAIPGVSASRQAASLLSDACWETCESLMDGPVHRCLMCSRASRHHATPMSVLFSMQDLDCARDWRTSFRAPPR